MTSRPSMILVLIHAIAFVATAQATEECLDCHRLKTPSAVRQWEGSAHARANVGCTECHGSNHDRIDKGAARVDIKVCGRCHPAAMREHSASRHGMGLHSGWGCTRSLKNRDSGECRFCHEEGSKTPVSQVHCARFLKQSSEMGELGCNRCHQVESSCAACHTNHATDLRIVRDPSVCATCHMGPDHPQWEMWQTSRHGTLFLTTGGVSGASCQTCHMGNKSHDVSHGITTTSGNAPYPPEKAAPEREKMLRVCTGCHAPAFARRELALGDTVRGQSILLVKEAERTIWDMADHNLLDPMPDNRPPHPISGGQLVLDSQMLYEDTSHIERLFFKMKKYDLAKAIKGAYHQNPAYTHWYGNAELKMDLVDIRAEASRLRRAGFTQGAPSRSKVSSDTGEERLRALKKKFGRGELSGIEYEREKSRILEELAGNPK